MLKYGATPQLLGLSSPISRRSEPQDGFGGWTQLWCERSRRTHSYEVALAYAKRTLTPSTHDAKPNPCGYHLQNLHPSGLLLRLLGGLFAGAKRENPHEAERENP